jgi:hypothetical protein
VGAAGAVDAAGLVIAELEQRLFEAEQGVLEAEQRFFTPGKRLFEAEQRLPAAVQPFVDPTAGEPRQRGTGPNFPCSTS